MPHRGIMTQDIAAAADRRFSERLAATGARDPREFYRGLLRELRERDETVYREMVVLYETSVIQAVGRGDADPLEAWLGFGVALAGASAGAGSAVVIDDSGRASPLEGVPRWDQLVLHLPEARGVRALPVGLPPELSEAQRATVDLLVKGKVRIPSDE
ncbi:MAG: hypothetical protein EA350_07395 [Gemmatimonadales bacterium]|nr:MAG: hypothetical protein EA350_07395 [Gemmatimonadales bacterium]